MKDPFKYSKTDRERLAILKQQDKQLRELSIPSPNERLINESEQLLKELGYNKELESIKKVKSL